MARVPILQQRGYLIATIQAAMTDSEAEGLQTDLMADVSRYRARGIIVDVTALDVLDSFAARTLRTTAHMTCCAAPRPCWWASSPRWPSPWSSSGSRWSTSGPRSTSRRAWPCSTTSCRGHDGERRAAGRLRRGELPIATDTDIVVARQEGAGAGGAGGRRPPPT